MNEMGGGSGDGNLLIVEDDAVIGRHLARAFARLGCSVQIARSCAEARVRAPQVFECGVFDIELGDGDGVTLAAALLDERCVRRAVFYTGSLEPEARRRAAALGPIVDKPSPFGMLVRRVMEAMGDGPWRPGSPKNP